MAVPATGAAALALLILLSSSFATLSEAKSLFNLLFPEVELSFRNDNSQDDVRYICSFTDGGDMKLLRPGESIRYRFRNFAFPMHWCYMYISKNSHGFFWAYTVRMKCKRCFWSFKKHPDFFFFTRSRWEQQKLFQPRGFNLTQYTHDITLLGNPNEPRPTFSDSKSILFV